jgi:hypothetical protein
VPECVIDLARSAAFCTGGLGAGGHRSNASSAESVSGCRKVVSQFGHEGLGPVVRPGALCDAQGGQGEGAGDASRAEVVQRVAVDDDARSDEQAVAQRGHGGFAGTLPAALARRIGRPQGRARAAAVVPVRSAGRANTWPRRRRSSDVRVAARRGSPEAARRCRVRRVRRRARRPARAIPRRWLASGGRTGCSCLADPADRSVRGRPAAMLRGPAGAARRLVARNSSFVLLGRHPDLRGVVGRAVGWLDLRSRPLLVALVGTCRYCSRARRSSSSS